MKVSEGRIVEVVMHTINNRSVIARGFTSDVYAWNDGQVLKLLHTGRSHADAEREYKVSQAIHAAGLPVPEVFDLVEVEGRTGIIFERLEGISFFRQVQARPWTLFRGTRQIAELHAAIHALPAPSGLPSQRERIRAKIESANSLSAGDRETALRCLEDLPDGDALCHGDFHPENIIATARGPMIIDWGSATRGHPLGDVAWTSSLIHNAPVPPGIPTFMRLLTEYSRLVLARTYLNRYLQLNPGSRQLIDTLQTLHALTARWPTGH